MRGSERLVIAHLSDTHVGFAPSTPERIRRVLDHLATFDPPVDVVLVTGDIADHGTAQEYAEASEVFARWPGPAPLLFCPGNHDVRTAYAAWRGLPADRPADEAHRVGGVLFCLADSLVPAPPGDRIDHGVLAPTTLAWLEDQLATRAAGERAVIALHHPPVPVGSAVMDPIMLRNADELAALLERHEDVVAVLTGHVHSICAARLGGVPVLMPGGVASTVTLDAEPYRYLTDELPPAFAVHLLDADGLVTHWRTLSGDVPGVGARD